MAKKQIKTKEVKKNNSTLAIVGLVLNIIILPGLGSLICGKTKQGIWQLVIFFGGIIVGLILTMTIIGAIIGLPLMIIAPLIAWIWGIVTGIQMIKESN